MILLKVVGSNQSALVDDCWAHLAKYRWRLDKQGYVMRKAGRRIYLHHVVMPGERWPEFVRDHINRDKLDNQSGNLRWLSRSESPQNRGPCQRNGTGVRGVRFDAGRQQFLARVQHEGKAVARAWFATAEEAAAYLDRIRPLVLPFSA
jgi:hypothetical protein